MVGDPCGWPFHHDPQCEECKQWEQKYGQDVDDWLKMKAELREAAKRERRNGKHRPGSV